MAAGKSKTTKKASRTPGVQESVKNVVDEVEKTGEALLNQVREQFEALGHRMSAAGSSVAHTATSVTETHMGSDITEILSKAMEHVREAVALDPTDPLQHENLVELLLARNRLREAAEALEAKMSVLQPELRDHLGGSDDAGCIYFADKERPAAEAPRHALRTIRPEAGVMYLFPSYFWHGVVPFEGERERICVAFDVIPHEH